MLPNKAWSGDLVKDALFILTVPADASEDEVNQFQEHWRHVFFGHDVPRLVVVYGAKLEMLHPDSACKIREAFGSMEMEASARTPEETKDLYRFLLEYKSPKEEPCSP